MAPPRPKPTAPAVPRPATLFQSQKATPNDAQITPPITAVVVPAKSYTTGPAMTITMTAKVAPKVPISAKIATLLGSLKDGFSPPDFLQCKFTRQVRSIVSSVVERRA
jgi:hypothetical protein